MSNTTHSSLTPVSTNGKDCINEEHLELIASAIAGLADHVAPGSIHHIDGSEPGVISVRKLCSGLSQLQIIRLANEVTK